ncbi:uncharacterized protein METZ01_LOCUS461162, partial [marine metagenome]
LPYSQPASVFSLESCQNGLAMAIRDDFCWFGNCPQMKFSSKELAI